MARQNVSAELAASHGLPGLLGISPDRKQVCVELDLPQRKDRIPKSFLPGLEALVIGFQVRLSESSPASTAKHLVAIGDDYVCAWLRKDDLDYFLVSLAAFIKGATIPRTGTTSEEAIKARVGEQ